MKVKIVLMIISLVFFSKMYAYTQCERPVKRVWSSFTQAETVWVSFSDGGSPIFKSQNQLTPGQMNRFTSIALTAHSTGKKLLVRYPEDNMACPPTDGEGRDDILGFWIMEN